MSAPDRPIAYLVNQYPGVSHSFIRREIQAIEALGHRVDRIAVRGWDAPLVDDGDVAEREKTRYLLKDGMGALAGATASRLVRHPGRVWAALRLAIRMSRNATRPWPYHLIYLAEACRLVNWLDASGARHLHAHFGTNAAEVACLTHTLGGPPYSFTSHGPAEADDGARLHLPTMVGDAAFVAAISSHTKSLILRRLPASLWDKVHVIHCGLTERAFPPAIAPEPTAPTFLFVGRLVPQKAPGLLLDAFAALDAPDARLVLAGDGEMRAELERRAAALGLGGRVRFTGWIATYIAGIPELVTPETGWLVPAGDAEALVGAMQTCLEVGPDARRSMGDAAQNRVRDRHLAATEAEKLVALFSN